MPKWTVPLLLYGVFLAIVTYVLAGRGIAPEPEFFATRPLPFNHLIVERDLQDATLRARSKPPVAKPAQQPPAPGDAVPAPNPAPAADAKNKTAPPKGASQTPANPAPPQEKPRPVSLMDPDPLKAKFVGKYTSGTIGQRQMLRPSELMSTPSLAPEGSALRVLLPVEANDVVAGKINAGTPLCVGRAVPDKVVAVICAAGLESPCNAVVDVPPTDAARLSPDILAHKKPAEAASSDNKCT
jgi:hypothetical protein